MGILAITTGALSITFNPYDGHTLPAVLNQHQKLTGIRAKEATADRGYVGKKEIGGTKNNIPQKFNQKLQTTYQQKKLKNNLKNERI